MRQRDIVDIIVQYDPSTGLYFARAQQSDQQEITILLSAKEASDSDEHIRFTVACTDQVNSVTPDCPIDRRGFNRIMHHRNGVIANNDLDNLCISVSPLDVGGSK